MISDSELWKKSLLGISAKLEKRYNQKKWSKHSLYSLEKELFLGLFSVRKLIESKKVSDEIKNKKVDLAAYPLNKQQVTMLNQHRFSELYDLYAAKKESLTYHEICNQFIHSSIYSPFVPLGSSLVGVFVASDWAKNKVLYYVPLVVIVEIMRAVGSNYPSKLQATYNESRKEYVISLAT